MKIALIADIHANMPALQTVTAHLEAWAPDVVVVAGDVVNRGPCPAECWRLVQQKQDQAGWLVIRGNHEDYVLNQAKADAPRSGPQFEIYRHSYWTYQQLNGHIPALQAMPVQCSLTGPDGGEVRITHASMRGRRDGIYPETTNHELRTQIAPAPPVFGVGHTHRPLVRRIDQTLVVNAGSVGLPFDGDTRTGYAQLEYWAGKWHVNLIRLDYDRHQIERDFLETDFIEGSGPLAYLILDELRSACSRLYHWTKQYQPLILSGQMSMADSVREFLSK